MALKVMLVTAGVLIGVVGGAALGIHAQDEGDMGTGAQTGVDGSDQGAGAPDVVPDLTEDASLQQPEPPEGVWDRLAQCESRGNWHIATGNGYFGGLQFDLPSWRAAGGSGRPDQASRAEQIRVGQNWQRIRGWSAWPACSRAVGLRP